MSRQESVSAVTVPGNVHVIQPAYAVASGSQEKPLKMTTYPASASTLQYNTESTNLQNPHIVIQNPAGMTPLQTQPTGLQYTVGMAGVQAPPGVIRYSPEITSVHVLPGDPQNPLNTVPGPTQTSGYPHGWNMSFMSFSEFDPKKFINEEVRTLGGIQILIGLFHIVTAVNPELYRSATVLGISGYPVWGGLSELPEVWLTHPVRLHWRKLIFPLPFIISGSLSVWAEKAASNSCMVNASIGMNIVSSIFSLLGIIIIIVTLSVSYPGFPLLTNCLLAVSGGLIPFALLEFIITCVVSHFGCQASCWTHFENMTVASTMFNGNTVNTTNGPVNTTNGPVNMTSEPVNMTNRPVNTTSPDSAINIPVQPTVQPTIPSNTPPGYSYEDVADLSQK